MNKLPVCVCAAAVSVFAAGTAFAANSAWSGTWKENLAKSKLTGHRYIITEKPGGMMHFNAGSVAYDFACDGKAYPIVPGETLTCTGSPQAGYDLTMAVNGHTTTKQHRTISADGKEMTFKGTDYRADGSTSQFEGVRKREGGGTGLVGTWVEAKNQDEKPDVETWSVNGDTLQVQMPTEKITVDVKLDGSEAKVSGQNMPPGATVTMKPEGSNKIRFERKQNGKVFQEGTYTLSADGKMMTEESWMPSRATEKVTIVYDKQ